MQYHAANLHSLTLPYAMWYAHMHMHARWITLFLAFMSFLSDCALGPLKPFRNASITA